MCVIRYNLIHKMYSFYLYCHYTHHSKISHHRYSARSEVVTIVTCTRQKYLPSESLSSSASCHSERTRRSDDEPSTRFVLTHWQITNCHERIVMIFAQLTTCYSRFTFFSLHFMVVNFIFYGASDVAVIQIYLYSYFTLCVHSHFMSYSPMAFVVLVQTDWMVQ